MTSTQPITSLKLTDKVKVNEDSWAAEKLVEVGIESGVKYVVKQAVLRVSWLSWGPLPAVMSFFLTRLFEYLAEKGIFLIQKAWITIEVSEDVDKLEKAVGHAREAKKKGYKLSDEELDQIDKELEDAARGLIRVGRGSDGLPI